MINRSANCRPGQGNGSNFKSAFLIFRPGRDWRNRYRLILRNCFLEISFEIVGFLQFLRLMDKIDLTSWKSFNPRRIKMVGIVRFRSSLYIYLLLSCSFSEVWTDGKEKFSENLMQVKVQNIYTEVYTID